MRSPALSVALFCSFALLSALACGDAVGGKGYSDKGHGSVDAPRTAAEMKLPRVGDVLPAIAGVTLSGEQIDNSTLLGKTTLVNLWFIH